MQWPRGVAGVRHSINVAKGAALLVLVEQGGEVVLLHVSLAEHPVIVIAALGALGFPTPKGE